MFISVDSLAAKLFVFVDTLFANNKDMLFQLGFLIAIANKVEDDKTMNIISNTVY